MSSNDYLESANETLLELITSAQNLMISAQEEFASAVAGLMPESASWPTPQIGNTSDVKELLEKNFAFQAKLLEANKAFSVALMEAWSKAVPNSTPAQKTNATGKKKPA